MDEIVVDEMPKREQAEEHTSAYYYVVSEEGESEEYDDIDSCWEWLGNYEGKVYLMTSTLIAVAAR